MISGANWVFESSKNMDPQHEYDRAFTEEEVCRAVIQAKNKKVAGYDGLVYELFKNNAAIKLLTVLFNKGLDRGKIPGMWLRAIVKPTPKSAASDRLNYRGISLLPTTSKIFTGLVASWVGGFLEKNNILVNKQNGFCPDCSCLDHIFMMNEVLRIRKGRNEETFCSFIDFQKAFDYVDH